MLTSCRSFFEVSNLFHLYKDCIALFLYCGLIFYLSHQSTIPTPLLFNHQDKLIHATAYALMGLLVWRVLTYNLKVKLWLVLFSLLFCSLYGFSDEYHQSFIDGRDADVWDWFADTIGAGLMLFGLSRVGYKL